MAQEIQEMYDLAAIGDLGNLGDQPDSLPLLAAMEIDGMQEDTQAVLNDLQNNADLGFLDALLA